MHFTIMIWINRIGGGIIFFSLTAMFNLVFVTNVASLTLWRSLGFTQIGLVPKAGALSNGQHVDAQMFYYDFTQQQQQQDEHEGQQ